MENVLRLSGLDSTAVASARTCCCCELTRTRGVADLRARVNDCMVSLYRLIALSVEATGGGGKVAAAAEVALACSRVDADWLVAAAHSSPRSHTSPGKPVYATRYPEPFQVFCNSSGSLKKL